MLVIFHHLISKTKEKEKETQKAPTFATAEDLQLFIFFGLLSTNLTWFMKDHCSLQLTWSFYLCYVTYADASCSGVWVVINLIWRSCLLAPFYFHSDICYCSFSCVWLYQPSAFYFFDCLRVLKVVAQWTEKKGKELIVRGSEAGTDVGHENCLNWVWCCRVPMAE